VTDRAGARERKSQQDRNRPTKQRMLKLHAEPRARDVRDVEQDTHRERKREREREREREESECVQGEKN